MPIKNINPGQKINPEKQHHAIDLRDKMTPAEKVLWQEIRTNKLGSHFRRQQVIAGFIVDFYCHSADLVVELDGDVHGEQKEYDAERDKVLEDMGLRVVRFSNDEVLLSLPRVLSQISEMIEKKKQIINGLGENRVAKGEMSGASSVLREVPPPAYPLRKLRGPSAGHLPQSPQQFCGRENYFGGRIWGRILDS